MVERVCPVCAIVYLADSKRLKWGRETTCSRTCSYILRGREKQTKTTFICGVCGKEFERSPMQVKGKYSSPFCSRTCHYAARSSGISKRVVTKPYVVTDAGRAAWLVGGKKTATIRRQRDNYHHTDASRAKLSIATARSLTERKRYVVSKIEHKVAAELDKIGVTYERQHGFRDHLGRFAFVVDFWFPMYATVIEVNGTYWHVDPRVYPTAINATQQRCLIRYQCKVDALAFLGIRVIEIWELDLQQDPAQAVLEAYRSLTRS